MEVLSTPQRAASMANRSASPLLAFIRRLAASRTHCELTDAELLQRFAVGRDESAFSTLMNRHGPMVLGVCQAVLQDVHDAEDVFQATFLVLVRKPKSVGKPASLASWLHGVAYRLAMKARTEAARRRVRERQAVTMATANPQDEVIARDLRQALHQEVDRLPERYRLPFVLCYLEGKTNEEAADLLGWPKGTVLSSLARARERLRGRLTRRGLVLTAGLLAAALSQDSATAGLPTALAESTLKAAILFAAGRGAAGGIAAPVLAYAESLLHAAFVAKLKLTAVILLALTVGGTGAGLFAYHARTGVHEDIVGANSAPAKLPQPSATSTAPPAQRPAEVGDTLQGAWIVTAAEQQGQRTGVLNNRRLVFDEKHFTLGTGRGEVSGIIPTARLDGDIALRPTNPKQIDFTERNWRLHGIYELEGTTLRICLSNALDSERPVEFATQPNSKHLLLLFEREEQAQQANKTKGSP
jgi:RNA polymerase sigma factor (sigma-70 family)